MPSRLEFINSALLKCERKIAMQAAGLLNASEEIKTESLIHFMVSEAIKSSEIEGEIIDEAELASSIRNHLGLNTEKKQVKDQKAEGISRVMVDVHNTFAEALSKKKIHEWHTMLFQGHSSLLNIRVGSYRTHKEPMQVVSGPIGKQKVHYEAPPSQILEKEMQTFIKWFNYTAPGKKEEIKSASLRAAIAHLYFESIHPYEDGNGRIGRAIAEKVLYQNIGRPVLLSLSQEIEAKKKLYYSSLSKAQKSNEITEWIKYFTEVIINSADSAEEQVKFIIEKSKFYERIKDQINPRQRKLINRMLQEGVKGFEGGIKASKYASLGKCSKATATRDLTELLNKGILRKLESGGRSTSYDLNL